MATAKIKILFTSKFWKFEKKKHHLKRIISYNIIICYSLFGLLTSIGLINALFSHITVNNVINFAVISSILTYISLVYAYLSSDIDEYLEENKTSKS